MDGGTRGRRLAGAVLETCWWWGATAGIWLLTLSSVTWPDLAAALACGLPSGLAARAGRHAMRARWRPRPAWARWLLLIPAAVLADTARVLGLAARGLAGSRPPGELREIRLPRGEGAAAASAHRAAGGLVISCAPGTFVVDGNQEDNMLVIHALTSGWPHLDRLVSR